jgi:hypothetical protein
MNWCTMMDKKSIYSGPIANWIRVARRRDNSCLSARASSPFRFVVCGLLASSVVLATGCDRNASQKSPFDQRVGTAEISAHSTIADLPPKCSSLVSSDDHDQYLFQHGVGFLIAYRDSGSGAGETCRTDGFGFNRFLLRNGAWLNRTELLALERAGEVELVDGVSVYVFDIVDKSSAPARTGLSAIGRPQSFEGVPLTKWTATADEIEAFNKTNPLRRTTSSPSWSINGTTDVRTGQPIQLGCVAPAGSGLSGDDLYTATFSTEIVRGRSSCTMWLSVDLGQTGIAVVKVEGFRSSNAQTIVANASQEINQRIKGMHQ